MVGLEEQQTLIDQYKDEWGAFLPILITLFRSGYVFKAVNGELWVARVEVVRFIKPHGKEATKIKVGEQDRVLKTQETFHLLHGDVQSKKQSGGDIQFIFGPEASGKNKLYLSLTFVLQIFKSLGVAFVDMEYKTKEIITWEKKNLSLAEHQLPIDEFAQRHGIPWLSEWIQAHIKQDHQPFVPWQAFSELLSESGNNLARIVDTVWEDVINQEKLNDGHVVRLGHGENSDYLLTIPFFLQCLQKCFSSYQLMINKPEPKTKKKRSN